MHHTQHTHTLCRTLKEEDQYPDNDLVEHDPEVDQHMTLLEAKQKAMEDQMEDQKVCTCVCMCGSMFPLCVYVCV